MKIFKPTYLYVKTHKITGLKYFGKTVSDNYYEYKGSGMLWMKHLEKHGFEIDTEIVGYFTDKDECEKFAIKFSRDNDIVKSQEWANLMIENGLCGGDIMSGKSDLEKSVIIEKRKITHSKKSKEELEESRLKNSNSIKKFIKENPEVRKQNCEKIVSARKTNGLPWHSEVTKIKIGKNSKSNTPEVKAKIAKALLGKKNPEHSKRMSAKAGLDRHHTKLYEVISPAGIVNLIIGIQNLKEFCKNNNLSFSYFSKQVNIGVIKFNKPRVIKLQVNCDGYEIKEISR